MNRPPTGGRPRARAVLSLLLAVGLSTVLGSWWLGARLGADEGSPPGPGVLTPEEEERLEAIDRHTEKGWQAFRTGNHDEVLARMERLAKLDPKNTLPDYLVARVKSRIGDYDEALRRADAGLALDPAHRPLEGLKLRLLLDLARPEAAAAAAEEALKARPDDLVAQTAVGLAHEERGRRAEALAAFDGVVAAYNKSEPHPEELPWVATAALRATWLSPNLADDLIPGALKLLKQYIEAHPDDQDVVLAYAHVYQQDRGGSSQSTAQKYYTALLKENSELADARVGLARYFLIFYQQDKAIQQLERALRTNPRHVGALALLASIHVSDGDYEKATGLLDRAREVAPKDKVARSVDAARRYITGKRAEYEALEKEILADDPTYARLYVTVSELVGERQRRYDVAAELAEKAVALDPTDALGYVVLGENLMNLGRTEDARKHFLAAVEKSRRYEDVKRDNWLDVLGHLDTFTTAETPNFRVRMHLSEAEILKPYLLPLLEDSWRALSAKYGFTPAGPILVDTFHRWDDFSVRSIGVPGLPALGVCFGRVITLLGPTARPLGAFSWSRTAWHEFAHVVTLQQSEGQVPRWLTEGLSVYEEKSRKALWGRDMEQELFDRWSNGRLLKMSEINAAFRGPDILFAYFQGGLIAEHLEATKGFDVVPKMLVRFAEDRTTEQVFRDVLALELADYDRLFADFVKGLVGSYKMVPRWDETTLRETETRVKADPQDAAAWTRLAWARLQRGRTIDAGAALAKARALTPEAPLVILLEGRLAEGSRRADLAASHYGRFLALGEDDLRARLFLAEQALKAGDSTKAIEHLEAAKLCFPTYREKDSPYLQLARLHEGAGDVPKALAEYEAFARIAPENYGVRSEKLKPAYLEKQDWAALIRVSEEMIDISPFGANRSDPPDLTLHRDFAAALLTQGRKDEAVRELTVQVALGERLPEEERVEAGVVKDRLALGNLLLDLGRAPEALEQAIGALRLSPDDAGATMLKARAREAGADR